MIRRALIVLPLFILSVLTARSAFSQDAPRLQFKDGDKVLFLGNTFIERDIHHGYLETLLALRHPGMRLTFRNMGWAGDTVDVQMRPLNFGTVEEHVRAYGPAVTFISYGMNESFAGEAGLESFITGYSAILDYVQDVSRDVVLLSPIRHEALGPPLPDPAEHNAQLRLYVDAIAKLAGERGCGFVNLFDTFPEGGGPLTDNGIHLNADGYCAVASVIAAQTLPPAPGPWRITCITRASAENPEISFDAEGTALSRIHISGDAIAFEARDAYLSDGGDDSAREIRFEGLPEGMYTLAIDGAPVLRAPAADWAEGMALPADAIAVPYEALRQTVLEKCEWYFFRWRAHNGEYIYGRRARTGDGNAGNPQFQDEHAEMDRIIAELDAKIAEQAIAKTRVFELKRLPLE